MRKSVVSATILAPALALGLSACGSPEPADEPAAEETAAAPMEATALLKTADGTDVGTVTATEAPDGLMIHIAALGMPAGEHGVHVHTTGACTPDFAAAGGHWNPDSHMHGLENDQGQHAGDMPNLTVGEDGTGSLDYTLGGGATWAGLMDADGSAFVVHAGADDQTTDPSGDSGDRIACGVFEAPGANEMAGALDTTT